MKYWIAISATLAAACAHVAAAGDLDEFRIKREAVFEFASPPTVRRSADQLTIAFQTKGLCDVTVAIENGQGRIVRHLASGVLGDRAPAPFLKSTRQQKLTWDGKDDAGRYIDDWSDLTVRVSLGLQARFERTLVSVPKRRSSRWPPRMAAAPEGVYVFDGGLGIDHLVLYSHDGDYVRTVYPFPADKIARTKGLVWHTFPQDGARLPLKTNFLQCTMLTSGTNAWNTQTYNRETKQFRSVVGASQNAHFGMYGGAASAVAIRGKRIALVHKFLNRLATDGTTGGLPLGGPRVTVTTPVRRTKPNPTVAVSPRSAALSPDGRWLYLAAYVHGKEGRASQDIIFTVDWRCIPVVMRLDMESDAPPVVFKGSTKPDGHGTDNAHFRVPASVATDADGRVYVGDYMNDRIQVYAPDGTFLKTIPTPRPARVLVHQRTGEIYAFSWLVQNEFETETPARKLVRFRSFERPEKVGEYALPIPSHFHTRYGTTGIEFVAAIDSWSAEPRFWVVQEHAAGNVLTRKSTYHGNIHILAIRDGRLEVFRDFGRDVARAGVNPILQHHQRQRLYVNPTNGRLYVAEGDHAAAGKSFHELFEVDPETGRVRRVPIPFNAEDMCFGPDGLAYLRSIRIVVRYDPKTGWQEVPWDYGGQYDRVAYGWSSGTKTAKTASGLVMPSDGNWHHGGMHVSVRGHLAVGCLFQYSMSVRTAAKYVHRKLKYEPLLYPGRLLGGRGGATLVHVWDRHGRIVHDDIVPGLGDLYGVAIDRDENVYVMSAATRVLDGKPYYNDMTGTVMKFPRGRGRVTTASDRIPVPLSETEYPKRPHDLVSSMQGAAWVDGAEWFYGGVGFGGKNKGTGCACWNFRFAHDYFARTFAPEMDRYSVAVLDSAGNLILRVGQYGNLDSAGPGSRVPLGGDEVGLFHGAYLATHTDRRLFIADPGNSRVVGVKLDYHQTKTLPLAGLGRPGDAKENVP